MDKTEIEKVIQLFEVQLPKLITSLEKISESLSQKTSVVKLPVEVPEDFLEDLYHGNLEIGACAANGYSHQGLKEIVWLQDELKNQLTSEQWELFRKYSDKINDSNLEETSRMFQHGFRLAVNLIAAGLQDSQNYK